MTELANRSDRIEDSTDERARRAVLAFRRLQPTLTAYARAMTGRPDVRVDMAATDNGSTDGTRIYIRPPMALGDTTPHQRRLCDSRDALGFPACPACAIREDVLVRVYHEISHIAFESFATIPASELRRAIARAVREASGVYADHVARRIESLGTSVDYVRLASTINEYMPFLINVLEDVRVDLELFKAKPGTRRMFEADARKIFTDGFEYVKDKGEVAIKKWSETPLNNQVLIGLLVKCLGYDYSTWFHEKVIEALSDEKLTEILSEMNSVKGVSDVYYLSFQVLARIRELGFCATEEDPDPEPEPEKDPEPEEEPDESPDSTPEQSNEDGDSGEESASDSDSVHEGAESEVSDQNDGDSVPEGESDMVGEGEEGDPSEDGDHSPDGNGSSDDSKEGESDSGSASSNEAEEHSEDEVDGSSGADDQDESEDSDDSHNDSGASESSDSSESSESGGSSDDGNSEPSGGDDDSGEDGTSGECDLDSGEVSRDGGGSERSPSISDDPPPSSSTGEPSSEGDDSPEDVDRDDDTESTDSAGTSMAGEGEAGLGSGVSEEEVSDGHSEDGGTSEALPMDGDGELRPEDESDFDLLDTGADDGYGGTSVEESLPEFGTPDDVEPYLLKWGDHDEKPTSMDSSEEKSAVDKAIIQGIYFTTPSSTIWGVREFRYGDEDEDDGAWSELRLERHNKRLLRKNIDTEVPESILQPALGRMRRAFSDNRRGASEYNRKSGKVNSRALGKRAGIGDPRVFKKNHLPGKKDYYVVIGMDLSYSTVGLNLALEKRAVRAQAELLHRVGIPFSIIGHSGRRMDRKVFNGTAVDVYHVKEYKEPWNQEVIDRLDALGPVSANLDGHAMEFLRKQLDAHDATDKILLYYSDGKMPAENHDEELSILTREIQICRHKGYTLLGVGIRTDSPARHGLETVQVDTDEDLVKVIQQLGKRLVKK